MTTTAPASCSAKLKDALAAERERSDRALATAHVRMTAALSASLFLTLVLAFAPWEQVPGAWADWLRFAMVIGATLLIGLGARSCSYEATSNAMNQPR